MDKLQKLQQMLEKNTVCARKFCETAFPAVSRTFAVNVGKLPPSLRFQVLVSYLLCRIADTVEDDPGLSPEQKERLLEEFVSLLGEQNSQKIQQFTQQCSKLGKEGADVLLTQNAHHVFTCFFRFPQGVQQHIAHWVSELAYGMGKYALRKQQKEAEQVTFLHSMEDLEHYCYYVAGTVGHLLSGLFYHHYACIDNKLYQKLETKATSFGLGLQLTNIVKDSVVDYHRGWCYLPSDYLKERDLHQGNFLEEENRDQSQQLMEQIILRAKYHLDNALEYSCLLPVRALKVRLFCFLPLMMAIKSLEKAAYNEQLFSLEDPVKISRLEVQEIVRYCYLNGWSNMRMVRWYQQASKRLHEKIATGNSLYSSQESYLQAI